MRRSLACVALVVSILASMARADVVTAGTILTLVTLSNTVTSSVPTVATAPTGETLVTWVRGGNPLSTLNVAFFNPAGNLISGPTVITLPGGQSPATTVAAATPTGFAIAYEVFPGGGVTAKDIYLRTFNLTGIEIGSGIVNTLTTLDEGRPSCDGYLNGDFIVAWARKRTGATPSAGIYVRRFSPNALPLDATEVRVDVGGSAVNVGYQDATSVSTWPSGRVCVAWQDGVNGSTLPTQSADGSGNGIFFAILDPGLNLAFGPAVANQITNRDQFEPNVACDDRNVCVIGWCGDTNTTLIDAYVRHFEDTGAPRQVADFNVTSANTTNNQFLMGAVITSNGETAITWMDEGATLTQPGPRPGFARFRQNHTLIESGLVESGGPSNETHSFPRLGSDQFGNLRVAWQVLRTGVAGNDIGLRFRTLNRNMISLGSPVVPNGGATSVFLDSPSDANAAYVVAASLTQGPLFLDTRFIPLGYDFLFDLSVFQGGGGVFFSFLGTLNAAGFTNFPAVVIPPTPPLSGVQVHLAFATGGSNAPSGVNTMSHATTLTIQ